MLSRVVNLGTCLQGEEQCQAAATRSAATQAVLPSPARAHVASAASLVCAAFKGRHGLEGHRLSSSCVADESGKHSRGGHRNSAFHRTSVLHCSFADACENVFPCSAFFEVQLCIREIGLSLPDKLPVAPGQICAEWTEQAHRRSQCHRSRRRAWARHWWPATGRGAVAAAQQTLVRPVRICARRMCAPVILLPGGCRP